MALYTLQRPWGGPFDQLRGEMEALLGRFGGTPALTGAAQGVFPAVNLYEAADAYVLTAELPGVEPDAIRVALEGHTVTLEGERNIDYGTGDDVSLHRRERQAGSFRRAFQLPATIDADKVEAVHKNGVLMLRLPKPQEHQPRRITVQPS